MGRKGESQFRQLPASDPNAPPPKSLSIYELLVVLKPYFWPSGGTDGYWLNRLRAMSTYAFVAASKTCSVFAPFQLIVATNALVRGDYDAAVQAIIFFCLLKFATSFFKEAQSAMYLKVKQQATIELAGLVYRHVHNLSLHWHLSKKTGNTIRVIDRGYEAADRLVTWLFLYLTPALGECVAVVLLFLLNYSSPKLGFIVLGGVMLYASSTIFVTKYRAKLKEKANKTDNSYHEIATDTILNYETVKYFTNEEYEIDRYVKAVEKYQQYNLKIFFSLNGLNGMQQLIMNFTLAGVMIVAAHQVSRGVITLGDWVAIYSWVMTIFVPLNFLGSIYQGIVQALVDIRNLSELLSTDTDLVDAPGAKSLFDGASASVSSTAVTDVDIEMGPLERGLKAAQDSARVAGGVLVQFKDVSFHYPSQPADRGLRGVSFVVQPGTTTAVVGPTGAGKTTIARLLMRFYDPKQGEILVHGCDIKSATQKSVRGSIGVVPQDIVLFNDSILHNIKYGNLAATQEQVEDAAKSAAIYDFVMSLPDKWETQVGERGLKLSGGEKQRVGIARCLLKDPPVVLLDEATSALDTLTENSIQEALTTLGKNRTVVVIAHRLSTIARADQIIVLKEGLVAERGTHEELLRDKGGEYAALWDMQTKASSGALDTLGQVGLES